MTTDQSAPGAQGDSTTKADVHWCKHCDTSFRIRVPETYTGDAIIKCPECGWQHPRQFEVGIAVSCDPPTTRPLILKAIKEIAL